MGKFEVTKPFGRSRPRWENNTKIYLTQKVGLEVVHCIYLAQGREKCRTRMNTQMKVRGSIKQEIFLVSRGRINFLKMCLMELVTSNLVTYLVIMVS